MAYEKKIEPITRLEVFIAGFTLQWFIVFFAILPFIGWSECATKIVEADVSSTDDVLKAHECISHNRGRILAGTTCLLIGYPIIIAHVYFAYRVEETVISFLSIGFIGWMYRASWLISCTVLCTIVPALCILISYYDWEFDQDDNHIGYAMQVQMGHFVFLLFDSVTIPLGLCATMPWIMFVSLLLGRSRSAHYTLSTEAMRQFTAGIFLNSKLAKWAMISFSIVAICVFLFSSIGDVLDFDQHGFFSYKGGSQYLGIILMISWELECIMYMRFACTLDQQMHFLSVNVKSIADGNGGGMGAQDSMQVEMN